MLSLDSDSIDVWQGEIIHEEKMYQHYWLILDEAEKNQALRFKFEALRHRYVCVHGRLRALLSRYLYQSPEKIKFAKTGHGKPYLPEHPELVFNLSHTENFMVIAVAINCHLGIDIEYYQHKDSLGSIINRYFASEEINYWNKQPEEFKTLEFYRLWTRKEAFLKATGLGIAHGLSSSIINPEKPDSMLSVPDGCGQITDWQLMAVDLGESIACSLAVDKTVSRVNLHSF